MTRPLDLQTIPLRGLHLIEASAGTGKTFAISNLVLRMVLEDGVGIEHILVLTFTNAATEELRERISARLRAALAVVNGGEAGDPILAAIVNAADPEIAGLRLAEALSRMDEAAIHTIHAFCQRLLRDNAFESGISFEPEMIQDESELRRLVTEDLWRRRMADADPTQAAWMLLNWPKGPASLLDTLAPYIGAAEFEVLPDPEQVVSSGEDLMAPLRDWRDRLRADWPVARDAVLGLLRDNAGLNRNSYRATSIEQIPAAVEGLIAAESLPDKLPDRFELLTPAKLAKATKKGHEPPRHAFFDLCAEVDDATLQSLHRRRRASFLGQARTALATALLEAKEARRVLYFDDLLSCTARVLDGPLAAVLAERVREAYPCALVDEFQDTDPLQYRIFRRVYDGHGHGDCGIFMIGDPKQAIYAFRGADIFTYMTARRHAVQQGSVWSLDTNWRSASALVGAVNTLFERADRPFVYDESIPFAPVKPSSNADAQPLLIDGNPVIPLQLRWLPLKPGYCTKKGDRLSADGALTLAAADCALQIAGLIGRAAAGTARIGERSLAARDIAVLVRKHNEGVRMRDALARRGIASVSIGNESVFDSDEAAELVLVLAALNDGADEGSIRTALATAILGWSASDIAALDSDDNGWDGLLARFDDYRQCWRNRGFLTAFWRLMEGEQVALNLRRLPGGERRLTNLLHLGELAQLAARQHPGIDNLLRWFKQRYNDPSAERDAQLLRLESDGELVRIVTLHKSKGLEFPVVFVPFPWTGPRGLDKAAPVPFHADDGRACLDLGSDAVDDNRARWKREHLAEGLRLLYVGLTRAEHLCTLYWGAVNQSGDSPAAYLLHPDPALDGPADRMGKRDASALRDALNDLVTRRPDAIRVDGAIQPDDARADDVQAGFAQAGAAPSSRPALSARGFGGEIRDDWRLTSYSGLAGGLDRDRPDYDAVGVNPDSGDFAGDSKAAATNTAPVASNLAAPDKTRDIVANALSDAQRQSVTDPVFRFPRGIRAGHCLHAMFEHLEFTVAVGEPLNRAVLQALSRHGIDRVWAETACLLVRRALDTSLQDRDASTGPRLRDLPDADRLNELEFHFPLERAEPSRLAELIRAHGYPDPGFGASIGPLRGLMKGYIDLVFRWNGRFFLADYKSNHLGDRVEDYARTNLDAAMTAHRYQLQYLIYCVALHRYLRLRVPGYDCRTHFGGVFYLFLRGMRPERGSGFGVYFDCPDPTLVESLDAALSDQPEVLS
ncbi:MAG: exodeoxyribonuclease V subunit beta [Thiohalocapsa sp.]